MSFDKEKADIVRTGGRVNGGDMYAFADKTRQPFQSYNNLRNPEIIWFVYGAVPLSVKRFIKRRNLVIGGFCAVRRRLHYLLGPKISSSTQKLSYRRQIATRCL